MPAVFRSVRFRLAVTYSLVVFGLAGLVIFGVNVAFSRSLEEQPVTEATIRRTIPTSFGRITFEETIRTQMVTLEELVNIEAQRKMRRLSLFGLAGMFPVSIGVGYLVAGRVLRPIDEIAAAANEIQSGDLSRRIGLVGPDDELTRLADTFDAMLDRLEDGAEASRAFVQDISHELRNPLAVMTTNLDVALSDPRPSVDSLTDTARIVRRTVDRTSRTVDELLAFAREGLPSPVRVEVDLARVAGDVLDEYRAIIDEAGLVVDARLEAVETVADRVALKRAIGNLVANAVAHGHGGGRLLVGTGVVGSWAWVGVEDDGPGIDAEDHATVFQRHWTTTEGEARGLGLAIVRQVAESHGGVVTLRSQPDVGSAFVLWLPSGDHPDPVAVASDGLHHDVDPFEV